MVVDSEEKNSHGEDCDQNRKFRKNKSHENKQWKAIRMEFLINKWTRYVN